MSDWKRFATDLPRLGLAVCLMALTGCGGGGSEEAASTEAPKAEAGKAEGEKSSTPTVKGLGATAKGRQDGIDAGAAGSAPADESANRKAMMQGQGGGPPPGAGPEVAAAGGSGAISPGQLSAPGGSGGYVPPGAGGPPGGGPGGPPGGGGGYVPPGSGGAGQGAFPGMMPPGGMGGPGGYGMPGGGSGSSGAVLLAQNAFADGGDALKTDVPASGGSGGSTADDFKDPMKAVESFLSAVKSKDPERVARVLSRRAPGEAKTAATKKILTSALDQSITPEGLNDLAKVFEDYTVENMNVGKSSGSVNVIIGRNLKNEAGKKILTQYERRIMRVQRDGPTNWKVVEFGNKIVNK